MRHHVRTFLICAAAAVPSVALADAPGLYGIHWWGYTGGAIDPQPAQLLDAPQFGGWDVEIINTHNEEWLKAPFMRPLYQDLNRNKNVSLVTRINYKWGETVPRPTLANGSANPDYANWKTAVVGQINTLAPYAHLWQLGNEPNIVGEGAGWANGQIDPLKYAELYRDVRSAVHSTAAASPTGPHRVLVAPPSPGGVIPGVRWMGGADWLELALHSIPPAEIDGIALHTYGPTVRDFRGALLEQIKVIDSFGLQDKPLYITEWNRYVGPDSPNAAQEEANSAQFVRDAYKFLNKWNRVAGNHNVVSASWFVYDNDPGWRGYSLEYWKNAGNPYGSSGDLYTAFEQTVDKRYAAGVVGTRAIPSSVRIFDNFESGNGNFNSSPGLSGTTRGIDRANSTAAPSGSESLTSFSSQKLTIVDSASDAMPWLVRHLFNGGNPSTSASDQIPLSAGNDGHVGLFLKTSASGLTIQLAFDPNGTNTAAGLDASVARAIVGDGEWHLYEWSLDDPSQFVAFPAAGSDGVLPSSGYVTIDSLLIASATNQNATIYFDTLAHNANGSLNVMVPEPHAGLVMVLSCWLLRRR